MKRIIIADDSATARMFVRRCLEVVGFTDAEFVEVNDGQEAMDNIQKGKPDLVVTDLFMHPVDGTELLRRIKSSAELSNIPVLVATSAKNPAKEAELLSMGAVSVLAKPVSPAAMMAALQEIPDKEQS